LRFSEGNAPVFTVTHHGIQVDGSNRVDIATVYAGIGVPTAGRRNRALKNEEEKHLGKFAKNSDQLKVPWENEP
jgi:hypothetical protein